MLLYESHGLPRPILGADLIPYGPRAGTEGKVIRLGKCICERLDRERLQIERRWARTDGCHAAGPKKAGRQHAARRGWGARIVAQRRSRPRRHGG